jgi:hypothetical protein
MGGIENMHEVSDIFGQEYLPLKSKVAFPKTEVLGKPQHSAKSASVYFYTLVIYPVMK